jgi:hypothetical protein
MYFNKQSNKCIIIAAKYDERSGLNDGTHYLFYKFNKSNGTLSINRHEMSLDSVLWNAKAILEYFDFSSKTNYVLT